MNLLIMVTAPLIVGYLAFSPRFAFCLSYTRAALRMSTNGQKRSFVNAKMTQTWDQAPVSEACSSSI